MPHSKQNCPCLLTTHLLLAGRFKGTDPPEPGRFHPHQSNHTGLGASALLTCPAVTGASSPISISFNYQRTTTSALCFVCPWEEPVSWLHIWPGCSPLAIRLKNPSLFKHTSVWFRSTNCNRKRLSEGLCRSTMHLQANPCSNIQDREGKNEELSESTSCMTCVLNHLSLR